VQAVDASKRHTRQKEKTKAKESLQSMSIALPMMVGIQLPLPSLPSIYFQFVKNKELN
jgi:hypothetical protein